MIKFQNILTTVALGCLAQFSASAGWDSDPDINLLVSGKNAVGQDLVMSDPVPAGAPKYNWTVELTPRPQPTTNRV